MAEVLPFPVRPRTDHPLGGCPKCGQSDGYMNIGGNHWFVCDTHNAAWCCGYNLFSGWRDESRDLHEANERKLRRMRVVTPIYPNPAPDSAA
jgi:hypothetical protein